MKLLRPLLWLLCRVRLWFSISAILDLECTDLTAGLPRFFHSGPLGEILAPLENQSLTDCGKALGDI